MFGKIGALSPSLWLESMGGRLEIEEPRPGRWWLDSGNAGSSNDGMWGTWSARDGMLRNGYTLHDDLEHYIDYGAQRFHHDPELLFSSHIGHPRVNVVADLVHRAE